MFHIGKKKTTTKKQTKETLTEENVLVVLVLGKRLAEIEGMDICVDTDFLLEGGTNSCGRMVGTASPSNAL